MNKKTTADHFDRVFAGKGAQDYRLTPDRLRGKDARILALLKGHPVTGARCLDIGSGTGRWLSFLSQMGAAALTAVDISDRALERAGAWCDAVHKVDVETHPLPLPSQAFDIVISFEVLEHLRDPGLFVAEVLRVARIGGLVVMTTPNLCSFASRIRMLAGGRPVVLASDPTHVRCYRKQEVRRLFDAHGQSVHFLPAGFSLNPMNPKSVLRVPAVNVLSSFDDSLVFYVRPAAVASV